MPREAGGEARPKPRKFVLRLAFTHLFNLLPRVTGQAAAPLRLCPFPETAAWEEGRKYFPETQQRGSALDTWLEGAPRTWAFTQHCWGQEMALAFVAVLLSVRVTALRPQELQGAAPGDVPATCGSHFLGWNLILVS